jgi:hypothetical protein
MSVNCRDIRQDYFVHLERSDSLEWDLGDLELGTLDGKDTDMSEGQLDRLSI